MADTALDLSIPSAANSDHVASVAPTQSSLPPDVSSDSGRASTSSNSDNDEPRARSTGDTRDRDSPVDIKPPPMTSSPLTDNGDFSEEEKDKSDRVAPVRPFKMYPMDAYSMVQSPIPGMATTAAFSPTAAASLASPMGAMPSMMETATVSPFALTPLTSHLLQRKRRAENRICGISAEDLKKTIPVPEEKKDDAYWERRRKNNEAAKRSRDSRRQKEEEIAMRAAFLEQENLKLRAQVAILKNETAKLHYMLYNRM